MAYIDRTEEIIDFLLTDNAADKLFRFIAEGGTTLEFCDFAGISYVDLMNAAAKHRELADLLNLADAAQNEWTRNRLLLELRRISIVDPRKLYDKEGNLLPADKLDADTAKSIQSYEVNDKYNKDGELIGTQYKYRFYDKIKAIEAIGRDLGMFMHKIKHEHSMSLEDLVNQTNQLDSNEGEDADDNK